MVSAFTIQKGVMGMKIVMMDLMKGDAQVCLGSFNRVFKVFKIPNIQFYDNLIFENWAYTIIRTIFFLRWL